MSGLKDDWHKIPLFSDIDPADLESMLTCIGGYERRYAAGEYIFHAKEQIKAIGLVLAGTVHMLKEDVWGNKTLLTVIREQDVFGETFACGNAFVASVSFYATSNSRILFLPFERVLRSCSMSCVFHHRLIRNVVTLMAEKNVQLMKKLEVVTKKTLRQKILTFLSLQAERQKGKYIVIDMNRQEMADYLCANRSALTRELTHMKADGLIDYDQNVFQLLGQEDKNVAIATPSR